MIQRILFVDHQGKLLGEEEGIVIIPVVGDILIGLNGERLRVTARELDCEKGEATIHTVKIGETE
jgi:hypothetical protein